jgi:hypothetical protein
MLPPLCASAARAALASSQVARVSTLNTRSQSRTSSDSSGPGRVMPAFEISVSSPPAQKASAWSTRRWHWSG